MNRIKFFVCLLLLLNNSIWAQISSNEFENIPLIIGREEFYDIYAITQDSSGYLWLGTVEGLIKYDGYDTKIYKQVSEDSTSLGGNAVRVLYVDSEDNLWAGTNSIVNRFDPTCDCFLRYNLSNGKENDQTISAITEDKEYTLWVGSRQGGLLRYDRQKDLFFIDPIAEEINNHITTLLADKENNLWIGTESSDREINAGGLLRLNAKDRTVDRFKHDPNNSKSLSHNWVSSLLEDNSGQIWVGTAKNGLNKFSKETGDFNRIVSDPKSPERFQPPQTKEHVEDLDYFVSVLHQDKKGDYWIGTIDVGLVQFDSRRNKSSFYVTSNLNKNHPLAFYEDRQGQLWLGDLISGLLKKDAYAREFTLYPNLQALQRSIESHVEPDVFWISTLRDGLHKLDIKSGNYQTFQHNVNDNKSIGHDMVRAAYEDVDGNLWIGLGPGSVGGGESGKGGLDRFNRKTETFKHYKIPNRRNPNFGHTIYTITPDENGFLWLATGQETILRFDRHNEIFKEYTFPNTTENSQIFVSRWKVGVIFGATDFGNKMLYRYDIEKDTFVEFLAGFNAIDIMDGEDGSYWLNAWNQGLLHYNPGLDSVRLYTKDDGLPSNLAVSFVKDEKDNLWITTRKGMVRFDLQTKVFSSDGLPIDFFHLANIKASDGQLFFGGEKGMYAFYPDQVNGNSFPPQVLLSGLLISGKPFELKKGNSKRLKLTYQENSLEFSFKAIHNSDPSKNKYQFKLTPFDKDWSQESTQRTVRYTNLKPDKYTLEVRAANVDGYWSKDIEAFSFVIKPAWWNTWWARIIGIVTLLFVFRTIVKFQREQAIKLEKEKRLRNELAQSKEIEKAYTTLKSTQAQLIQSEKMASLGELTAGIAHEIQNPLNFVNNFSEVSGELIEEAQEELENGEVEEVKAILTDLHQNLTKINHHGGRASGIVKGMLEHSRTGAGEKQLTDINELADEYLRLAYHGMRAKNNTFNASFETDFDANLPKINVVPQDIGRVFLNLINNAFQAVDEKAKQINDPNYKPEVKIKSSFVPSAADGILENQFQLTISDNGPGIPTDIIDKIFQPFFTTKPTGQGTGLGLSLSYDIVKAHGGELSVKSEKNDGSVFLISLPSV